MHVAIAVSTLVASHIQWIKYVFDHEDFVQANRQRMNTVMYIYIPASHSSHIYKVYLLYSSKLYIAMNSYIYRQAIRVLTIKQSAVARSLSTIAAYSQQLAKITNGFRI